MERVWWEQITNARRFREEIRNELLDLKSIVVCVPQNLQWYDELCAMVQEEIRNQDCRNSFEVVEAAAIQGDFGEYVLKSYCKWERQLDYRPNKSHGEFLADSQDIVLNDLYVWVKDIPHGRFPEFLNFLSDYHRHVKSKRHGVFILELKGRCKNPEKKKGIKNIIWEQWVGKYDITMFGLLVLSEWNAPILMKQYVAEMASSLSGMNAQLCGTLALRKEGFVKDIETVFSEATQGVGLSGEEATQAGQRDLDERIWEVQLKVIFPLIEKFRDGFIRKYEKQIEVLLPLKAAYGEQVSEVSMVELGTLKFLHDSRHITVVPEDVKALELLRNARNTLAHLKTIPFEDVKAIMELKP